MAVELRDLVEETAIRVDTELGPAMLRRYVSDNRFDAVHASVLWQSSSNDRWGHVEMAQDRARYVANLYEKIDRCELLVPA
jgi:hypothetical protein